MKLHLFLFFLLSCAGPEPKSSQTIDKTLRRKDAPEFLLKATPQGEHIDDVEYFIKKTGKLTTYELKYEDQDEEVSFHFDEKGKILEREQDISFSKLDKEVRDLIQNHLKKRFDKFHIEETELRTNEQGQKFIDVEVSHGEKPTGLSELSYTPSGEFVSEEVESMPPIETLN